MRFNIRFTKDLIIGNIKQITTKKVLKNYDIDILLTDEKTLIFKEALTKA